MTTLKIWSTISRESSLKFKKASSKNKQRERRMIATISTNFQRNLRRSIHSSDLKRRIERRPRKES